MASQLSPRQREILDLVAEGRTSKEIATTLGISESTVNWHLANAFQRLGASSRAEAVALAIRSNGVDRLNEPTARARRPPAAVPAATRAAWPRLAAVAIAIAIGGALLGGATVATLRLGPIEPVPTPTASPANDSDRSPTSSPASGVHEDVVGSEVVPVGGGVNVGADPIQGGGLLPGSPGTILPVVGVPPLPSVPLPSLPVPVPTPALPSLPVVAPPPLPSLPIPAPTPIPTPRLSLP